MSMTADVPAVEAAIVEMTNTARVEARIGRVATNPQLTAAARAYALVLAGGRKLSHTADGTTMSGRVAKTGYTSCMLSENLAMHQSSRGFETRTLARAMVEGWLNSPGHRENLMAPEVTEIGVAVVKAADTDPRYIAVQLFARPQSMVVEIQVSNTSGHVVRVTLDDRTTDVGPRSALTASTCGPGVLTLSADGERAFTARYDTAGTKTYVVTEPKGRGPLTVELRERYTVR
jgi:hypothetical protein